MKSREQIKMDFKKARAEANQLERVADQLKTLASQKLEQSMQDLSLAWTGSNSRFFLRKESQLKEDIIETARTLYEIASEIRTIARRVYEAEMQAYAIAARRDS